MRIPRDRLCSRRSRLHYRRPVEPKPDSPRPLPGIPDTSTTSGASTDATSYCAMRSPVRHTHSVSPRLIKMTRTSPR
jgi:hypothetical protein